MNLRAYPDLLRIQGVAVTLGAAVLSRTAVIMLAIPLSFLVKDLTGSFAWSGAVLACHALGVAVAAPLWARRADRFGARRVLVGTGVAWSILVALLSVAGDLAFALVPVLAAAAGVLMPPVAPMLRAAWPRLVAPARLRTAYTLDATAQELMFMTGPLTGALLVSLISPRAGLLMAAAVAVTGTVWFGRQPVIDRPARPREEHLGFAETVLVRERVLILLSFFCSVVGLAACSLGIVAFAEQEGQRVLSGVLESVWAIGSFLGGLVAGSLPGLHRSLAWRRTAVAAAAMLGCVAASTWTPLALGIALFWSGSLLAPVFAALYERLGSLTVDAARAEVFGWMGTAGTAGMAAGSALGGAVSEWLGVPEVFGLSTVLLGLAAVLQLGVPPLEPDTEDVPVAATA